MKIVYAGTPEFATLPLKNLIEAGYEVVGVVTQVDKPQGRKGVLTPPPVKTLALSYGLPVLQSEKLKNDVDALRALGGDIMVTCAYGQILTQEILDAFPLGVWNIHAGLLPKYRGASPIQSCIINGETETGVSIMKTELGLDCGDIICVEKTQILESETYGELSDRLSKIGAELLLTALTALKSGNYALQKQSEEGVGVVKKIGKEHAQIDFAKTAKEIVNLVRGTNPAPVAFTRVGDLKINVYRAEVVAVGDNEREDFQKAQIGEILADSPKRGLLVKCADGIVKLTEVQSAGGKKMSGGDFLNGRKVMKGQVFIC
ncbi:MAG: methionyl-tRNA formyltransferase [Clostridiales bacterium]|nr:methionyl-tRNA formyltransferase [Clostridiales bacterium]